LSLFRIPNSCPAAFTKSTKAVKFARLDQELRLEFPAAFGR